MFCVTYVYTMLCLFLLPLTSNQLCVHVYIALLPPTLFLSLLPNNLLFCLLHLCVCAVFPLSSSLLPAPPLPRFSLLLLEFGEIYFEDFSAIYYPNASTISESIDRYISVHELMSGLLIVECIYNVHVSYITHMHKHTHICTCTESKGVG